MQDTEPTEFNEVLHSRRSVRLYKKEPVPASIMHKSLEAALLAANSSNLQMWEFYWLKNQEKKEALVKACLSQPAAKTAAELVVCVARTDSWQKNSQKILEILKQNNAPKAALTTTKK